MNTRGFTLIEVLIALAILAIAMAAISRTSIVATDTTLALKERTLGTWIAQNRLADNIAHKRFPSTGTNEGEETQAGVAFKWRETVSETPEPHFRRIEIQVFSPTDPNRTIGNLIGFLSKP